MNPMRKMNRKLLAPLVYVLITAWLHNGFAATQLEGVEWRLIELGGLPLGLLEGREPPTLLLDPEKDQATGNTGCNNYFSQYTLKGSTLTFSTIAATRRACTDLEGVTEANFFTALERTSRWEIEDGKLSLFSGADVLARFASDKTM